METVVISGQRVSLSAVTVDRPRKDSQDWMEFLT